MLKQSDEFIAKQAAINEAAKRGMWLSSTKGEVPIGDINGAHLANIIRKLTADGYSIPHELLIENTKRDDMAAMNDAPHGDWWTR